MQLTPENLKNARDFILVNARMIERRLFHFYFEQGSAEGVYHALYAYRNEDGGFGHGMEPDTASPESQPLFSIMALETLDEVSYLNKEIILEDFMPYFEKITTEKGGIPWMFRPLSNYPCQDHFKTVKEWAALSTTSSLLGLLEKYKVNHPWMVTAEEFVWSEFERIQDRHSFCYLCVPRWLCFLRHTKNRIKAEKQLNYLKKSILLKNYRCVDYSDEGWGLYGKPHSLDYAPSPTGILATLYDQEIINADLDELIRRQKQDGRWDTWYGLSDGTRLEWAGMQTLYTLKILKNYNSIDF